MSYRWSSQYFESTDGLPYIGHLPGHPDNIFVATGFGGNGMIYGSLSAILLCDLIVQGNSPLEELLDPNRIKLVAGFANFVKEAADVVGKLVGGLFPAERLPFLADIALDEGRIVEFEGKKMGIYKDTEGKYLPLIRVVHISNARLNGMGQKNMGLPLPWIAVLFYGRGINGTGAEEPGGI